MAAEQITLDTLMATPSKTIQLKIVTCTHSSATHKDAEAAVTYAVALFFHTEHSQIEIADLLKEIQVTYRHSVKAFIVSASELIANAIGNEQFIRATVPGPNTAYKLEPMNYTGPTVATGKKTSTIYKFKALVLAGTREAQLDAKPIVEETAAEAVKTIGLRLTRFDRAKDSNMDRPLNFYYGECELVDPLNPVQPQLIYKTAQPKAATGSVIDIKWSNEFLETHGCCIRCQKPNDSRRMQFMCGCEAQPKPKKQKMDKAAILAMYAAVN